MRGGGKISVLGIKSGATISQTGRGATPEGEGEFRQIGGDNGSGRGQRDGGGGSRKQNGGEWRPKPVGDEPGRTRLARGEGGWTAMEVRDGTSPLQGSRGRVERFDPCKP